MKRNLYGKKMLIADLLIVSLLALFALHFVWDNDERTDVTLPEISPEMTVTQSDDGKITLYAYDTTCGGTSPDFSTYIQYQSGNTIVTDYLHLCTESDYVCGSDINKDGVDFYDGSFCTIISQIPISETETGYLIDSYYRVSSAEGSKEAYLVKFEDGKLKKLPFVSRDGEITNSAECYYNIPDWYFATDGLGWDWVMSFDKETNTLYVPEQGEMEMTDRYDLYQYKNGKMRYIGNDAGFWLHPTLRDIAYLQGIYQTDTKLIRIDMTTDGAYRYASWTKPKPMSATPDLLLYEDPSEKSDTSLVFKNGDYTYILPSSRPNGTPANLTIKHKNKIIQQSKL